MLSEYGDIMSAADIAEILHVGKNTVYEMLESRTIKGFRINRSWRITKESLENYLKEQSA